MEHRNACTFSFLVLLAFGTGCTPVTYSQSTRPPAGPKFARAEADFLAGNYHAAERRYSLLALEPGTEKLWARYWRGRCRLALGRNREALMDFNATHTSAEPLRSYGLMAAGDIALTGGSPATALARFSQADPTCVRQDSLHYKKGLCYEQLGQAAQAKVYWRDLMRLFPDSDLRVAARERLKNRAISDEDTSGEWAGHYWIQLGIFSSAARARTLQAHARATGVTPLVRIVKTGSGRGVRFHLRAGPFENKQQAVRVRGLFKARGLDAMVKKRTNKH